MPPGPPKPKKAPHLSVATTDAQLRAWTRAAELSRRSLSSWVRFTLDDAADDQMLEAAGGEGEARGRAALKKRVDKLYRQVGQLVAELGSGTAPTTKRAPRGRGSR